MLPIILEVEISFNIENGAVTVLGFGRRQHGRQHAAELHLCIVFVPKVLHIFWRHRYILATRSFDAVTLTSNF